MLSSLSAVRSPATEERETRSRTQSENEKGTYSLSLVNQKIITCIVVRRSPPPHSYSVIPHVALRFLSSVRHLREHPLRPFRLPGHSRRCENNRAAQKLIRRRRRRRRRVHIRFFRILFVCIPSPFVASFFGLLALVIASPYSASPVSLSRD